MEWQDIGSSRNENEWMGMSINSCSPFYIIFRHTFEGMVKDIECSLIYLDASSLEITAKLASRGLISKVCAGVSKRLIASNFCS